MAEPLCDEMGKIATKSRDDSSHSGLIIEEAQELPARCAGAATRMLGSASDFQHGSSRGCLYFIRQKIHSNDATEAMQSKRNS